MSDLNKICISPLKFPTTSFWSSTKNLNSSSCICHYQTEIWKTKINRLQVFFKVLTKIDTIIMYILVVQPEETLNCN